MDKKFSGKIITGPKVTIKIKLFNAQIVTGQLVSKRNFVGQIVTGQFFPRDISYSNIIQTMHENFPNK